MTEKTPSTDRFCDFAVSEQRLPPFSFQAAFSVAWRVLGQHYWLLVGAGIAYLGVGNLADLFGVLLGRFVWEGYLIEPFENGRLEVTSTSLLNLLSSLFLMPALQAGFLYLGLLAVRCQAPGFSKLLRGFGSYWVLVRVNLLRLLILAIPGVLLAAGLGVGYLIGSPAGDPSQGGTTALFLVGPPALILWIYLYARLSFAALLIIDPLSHVSSARAALRASASVTRPVAWRLAAVLCAVPVLVLLSFACFFLPAFLLGVPLSCVVLPATYEMVRSQIRAAEAEA
ncbi:MAG: hypothetical protein CMJ84_00280 [Planctomycetes bacterium]|jgi:hypothetical protein|nr:hypothetical protein [Planctomycetota bacterium]MDP6409554.1 hypothetical protein [Planctomycetota bacterium]